MRPIIVAFLTSSLDPGSSSQVLNRSQHHSSKTLRFTTDTIDNMTKKDMSAKIAMGKFTSLPYGEQVAADTLEEWGIDPTDQVRTTDVQNRARAVNLFGTINGTVLTIDSKDTAESVLRLLTQKLDLDFKPKTLKLGQADKTQLEKNAHSLAGHGMFIIQNANANLGAVKNLVKLFQSMGWKYTEPAKNASGEVNEILADCKLPAVLKRRLVEHVGDQYDLLLPVVRGIRDLTDRQQREMTWEELWVRMNPNPGSIPPWGSNGSPGLFDHVIQGRTEDAVAFYQRLVDSGTPPIQFAAWFANQVGQYATMKLLVDYHDVDLDTASHIVGLPAPSSGRYPDPLVGKRTGWLTEKNFRFIQRRRIKRNVLRQLVKRTADDLAMIKKSGRMPVTDVMGDPILDGNGEELVQVLDRPIDEMLDDVSTGMRMVFRAAAVFGGMM